MEVVECLSLFGLVQRCWTTVTEAFSMRRARFVKSTTFRRRCASVFMSGANFLGQMILLTANDLRQG
jgi:hypothetical protein